MLVLIIEKHFCQFIKHMNIINLIKLVTLKYKEITFFITNLKIYHLHSYYSIEKEFKTLTLVC